MRTTTVMAALLAASALAAPAGAQGIRNLDEEASNVRSFTGTYDDAPVRFEVTVPANQALRIDAVATSDLDPVLRVYNAKTGELIVENDDGGDDLNSRATVSAAEEMRLRIEVSSFAEAASDGSADGGFVSPLTFDLRLTSLEFSPQSMRKVSWGAEETGQFFGGEEHLFTFTGEEGLLLEVALVADSDIGNELDPYLVLRDANGQTLAEDDDGGGDLNSLLRYVMTGDETYTIVATGLGDSVGGYTLRVGPRREPVVQAPLQVIAIGDQTAGRIGAGYENGDLDPASLLFQLSDSALAAIRGGAGEITVRMVAVESSDPDFANSLDPYLELGFDTPLGFAVVQSDDDGAGELNAMIPIDLSSIAQSSELLDALRIKVSGFGGSAGDFTVSVSAGLEPVESEYEDYLETSLVPPAASPLLR